MSTFSGLIKEIPNISIDRFDNNNLQSCIFFLSHCHTDHMVGLSELSKESLPGPLYTSNVSSVFIKENFKNITNIICLDIGVPTLIKIDNTNHLFLTVTTLPAGHCPGSVMFLFEYNNKRILYTGDFRLSINCVRKMNAFKHNHKLLEIDSCYLDSTFLNRKYTDFPTQTESITEICNFIDNWLKKDPKNLVLIKLPARYGYEYLFIEVYKRLNIQIHAYNYESYLYLQEMDNCFINDESETRIHACFLKSKMTNQNKYCKAIVGQENYLLTICPSALIWTNWKKKHKISIKDKTEKNLYRVCYSNHSSLNEIKDFLFYLKPKDVHFNVQPTNTKENLLMKNLLVEIMDNYMPKINLCEEESNTFIKFNNLFKTNNKCKKKSCDYDSLDEDNPFYDDKIIKRIKN